MLVSCVRLNASSTDKLLHVFYVILATVQHTFLFLCRNSEQLLLALCSFVWLTFHTRNIAEKPARRHVASRSMHSLRDIRLQTVGWPWNWEWSHSRWHHSIACFLFDFYGNYGRISHRFRDTPTYWSKIAQFSHPLVFDVPVVMGVAVGVKLRRPVTKN